MPDLGLSLLLRRIYGAVLILAVMALSGCYISRLALYQNNLFNGRRPLEQVIADPATSIEERERLKWVQEIIAFAATENLNTEDSYRYFVDVPGGVISYTVQACDPFAFKQVTWWFPFTGRVPYLGYFDKVDRDKMAEELKAKGFDVAGGQVAGFSSLGWFEDPVYSPMLRRDKASLAHLLLHELTHRTVWVKGSAEFNEQLAEFAGEELTRKLLSRRGMTKELEGFNADQRDEVRFEGWIHSLKDKLDGLYRSFGDQPPPDGAQQKQALIQKWVRDSLPKFETKHFDFVAKRDWNNASILGSQLYAPDRQRFNQALKCSNAPKTGDWLRKWSELIDSSADPLGQILKHCL